MQINLGRVNLAGLAPKRLPRMLPVRQAFTSKRIDPADLPKTIAEQFRREGIGDTIKPGMRIAIGVGSRGIGNLAAIVRAVVSELRSRGADPFIVPAMGSHGGGTAEGQRDVLAGYGITEDHVGARIAASMDTVHVGTVQDEVEVHFDKTAYEQADGIVVVARIKPHTDFKAPIESGITKMLTIGLGKHKGAAYLHQFGFQRFGTLLPAAASLLLERTPFLFGIGIVEDAYHDTALVECVAKAELPHREQELLIEAKRLMPRLWMTDIDVLVVDQIGKNISGSGMDPNITGRSGAGGIFGDGPRIHKIAVLGLTLETKGNAVGIGLADFTTRRTVEQIDFAAMYTNVITSLGTEGGRLPIIMESDEAAIAAAVFSSGARDHAQVKIVRIRDTLSLHEIYVSEGFCPEVEAHPLMQPTGSLQDWPFNGAGDVVTE
ncbi:hypothetical protein [Bacillus sp. 3255]|uniref:hypothetical protein n=1 Tax=Bacillus sp. 3255 TaxID=2817904 RepID=UPI00285FDD44|nr:hypothetical protein [Bacillus sp. 3255]MDR6881358.1 hypothetical protein [Bacillus sp. 3255]